MAVMNYHITGQGYLTAETPIAVSPPDHFDEGRRVLRLPREVVYRDGSPQRFPIIPASTIRGVLRHAVTGHAFESLNDTAKKKMFKVNDYIWTAQGGVTDKKEEGVEDFVEISVPERVRQENPIMGLFGNFTYKMGSLVEMRSARAVDGENAIMLVSAQVRTEPLERDYSLLGLFDKTDLGAFKDELIARRMMVKAENQAERLATRLKEVEDGKREMKPDEVKKLKDEIEKLKKQADDLGEKAGGAVNLQQITTRYEAISAGSQLEHGWALKDVSLDEAAVFLLAWRAWVANGSRVGAVSRNGFGKLNGYYDILIKPSQGPERLNAPTRAGRLKFSYETGVEIDTDNEVMRRIVEAESALRSGGLANWNLKSA
jgi:CRISPR type IV-associated protein Csf2